MVVDITDIKSLSDELAKQIRSQADHHTQMRLSRQYYKNSAFYAARAGDSKDKRFLKANLLKVFARKNIQYTADLPTFKIPTPVGDPEARRMASVREKIVYGVHNLNNTKLMQKKFAFDATIFSEAIGVVDFDFNTRQVKIERYDPRYCFYAFSNDNDRRLLTFWAVYPITKEECQQRYGVTPSTSYIDTRVLQLDESLSHLDGRDRFMMAVRIDDKTRVSWVGDVFIEEPHEHQMGFIPVDMCVPFEDGDTNQYGAFFLEDLVPLQAELNETIRRRGSIVRRMAAPLLYGSGLMNRQFDDIERKLKSDGGGAVGLRANGTLGLLQIQDTNMLDNHKNDIIADMMRISGFSGASFGELMGANTSGDALGMYFTPTTRHINDQMISWIAFWESINAKILRLYDKFGLLTEEFSLTGYMPTGTVQSVSDGEDLRLVRGGAFSLTFSRYDIDGQYTTMVIPPSVTPKDDIASKRYFMDAANSGFMSRTTAYEEIGIPSPEDELDLLVHEQSNPVLNPEGMQRIASALSVAGASGFAPGESQDNITED